MYAVARAVYRPNRLEIEAGNPLGSYSRRLAAISRSEAWLQAAQAAQANWD
jgi:hypothetical protein